MNHFSQRRSKMTLLLSICFSLISSFGFTQLTVTKTYSPGSSISIDGCGTYCTTLPGVTFSSADFSPGACEITDVNVNIVWAKTDGSCTSPGVGSSFHSETNFRIDGPDGVNEILVLPGSYSGNGTISSVSTTLDQSAGSTIGGVDPFSGTFRPNNGNLDNFNGTNAFGTWALRAGDTGAGDPLCIVSYSVTVTLSASDVSAPVPDLATLSDVTAECEVTSLTAPTATDNCGVVTVTNDVTLPITTQGTTVVTWTYDDGNGNTSTQTQNVIITDATAPVADIATLSDITAECEVTSLTAPTATDNCGVVTVTNDATLPVSSQGTTVVTWTYDDGNGNTSTQTQNVVITDVSAPVADVSSLSDITAECEVTSLTAPTATDNCGGTVTVTNDATLPITTQGTTVVTWTYDDGNGNTSTQTQNVVITDATAPVADIATLSDITAECEVTSLTAPTATDNCGGTVTVTNDATLPITTQGTTVVTWTYDDGNGNTSTQTQNVVITDATAPVADIPTLSDVTAECVINAGDIPQPTATDNCGGTVLVTSDAVYPITTQGTTVVTWMYDDGNGNTSTQTQNVVITDVSAPVADVSSLSDITAECEVTSLTAPTATDNCGGTVTVTNDATLPITTQGTTVVTWTYDDGNGNTSTQTQNVVITDAIAPTASNPTALSFECLADAVVDISVVTDEADNCLGPITVSHVSDVVTGNGCQDTITRTYNVADESGNNIDVVQMIYIEDVTAPTASNPTTLNVQCAADIPAPVTGWVTDEADNCGVPTVTWVNDVSDGLTCPETITRTFAVTDNCGNSINVIQLVVVQDIDAPIFDVASLVTETAFCDVTLTPPTATDNCSGVITATTTQVFPINTLGTTTVTWNYVDDCGNTSSQTQDVVIESIDVSTYIANDGISIVSSNVTAGVTYQWIDCSAGNTPLVGETNHNFTPTYSSDFAVIITEDGCSDTSACVTVTEVGLTDLSAGTLTFSPNPTIDGNFKINYDGQIKSIEVVDLIGRSVRLPIDLNEGLVNGSQLSAGKYLVRVVTIENQEMIGTIIIQK